MFELTREQIEGFAAQKARYLPARISAGPEFRKAISQHIAGLRELAEPVVCARRKQFMGSAVAEDQFRERILLSDGARVVIGGIRFRNLDANFPFVEVNASFDLFELDDISRVASLANEQFADFAPKGVLAIGPPGIATSTGVLRWAHTLCGSTSISRKPELPAGLTCSFPASVDFYDAYRTAYADWQARSPGLSAVVRAEPKEDLEASAAQGLLASFADPLGWCGVIAAREEPLYGSPALYIYEIFLVDRWRGKGAAAAVDAALVSKLAGRDPLVWESIHSENLPSLRVALSQGRSVLETEYFFPY